MVFETGSCSHSYAQAFPPFIIALVVTLLILFPSSKTYQAVLSPFRPFLTLPEAEELTGEKLTTEESLGHRVKPRLWKTICLSCLALGETVAWFGTASYSMSLSNGALNCDTVPPLLTALSWLPAVVIPVIRPTATPPYDLFLYYVVQFGMTLFTIGVVWLKGTDSSGVVVGSGINLLACVALLGLVLAMPLNVWRDDIDELSETDTSPEDYTSLWKWMTFGWIYPLIEKGMFETLKESDVWNVSPLIRSKALYEKLMATSRKSLFRQLLAANALDVTLDITLTIFSVFLNYAGPFFLNRILLTLSLPTTEKTFSTVAIYAFMAFFSSLCKSEADMLHLWHSRRASIRVRVEIMTLIYRKALVRKSFEGTVHGDQAKNGKSENADVGKILNLMSGDANRLSMAVAAMHWVYGAPFEIAIATIFLYQLLGLSAFAGLLCVILASPINKALAKRTVGIEVHTLEARDKRLGLVTELLNSAKFVKLSGWENHWIKRILTARAIELRWLTRSRIVQVIFTAFWACVPIIVSVVSFTVFVLSGHELTIPVAFTAISLFNMVRTPLNGLPDWLTQILRNGVSIKRLEAFLEEDEVPEKVSSLKRASNPSAIPDSESHLGIRNASFTWNSLVKDDSDTVNGESGRFELRDIDVMFPEGKLSLITGPTGSGKTALLTALLGEMTMLHNGDDSNAHTFLPKDMSVESRDFAGISYASQTPFLQNQTIRSNILFDQPYDADRYAAVLEAAALVPDLQELEKGDETLVGSRGVSLSGGQKARVALARAVYARSRYVLLDDVLSAVDSHTAVHLFQRLLCGPLLSNRTVVLVTHNVELVLPAAYYIVHLLDGRIQAQGIVDDIRDQGYLDNILKSSTEHAPVVPDSEVKQDGNGTIGNGFKESMPHSASAAQDEFKGEGGVKWSVYNVYLKSASYATWVSLALGIILYQFFGVAEKLWIKQWGEAYIQSSNMSFYPLSTNGDLERHMRLQDVSILQAQSTSLPSANNHPGFYVGIYAAITFSGAFISVINTYIEYFGGLRASGVLFKKLLASVMYATIRWHDTTPTGRMLNRFSKDIENIDTSLGSSIQAMTSSAATLITSVGVIVIFSPTFILPAAVIGCLYYMIVIRYLNVARDLRRMEANSRSPVFTDFSDLLSGIVTIRAFSAEKKFLDILHQKIDATTKMSYYFWMTSRWLSLRLDVLGACAVLLTTLLAAEIGAGLAGVTITSALAITSATYWACRNWTDLELNLNSVERLIEYLELPQEPQASQMLKANSPPAYWPSNSNEESLIEVEGLNMRHAPNLPVVLHDISFTLKARERVGIVGRTGSGKSTLAMSLLRFTEPWSGTIRIDGINISTIGLQDLRSRITFVAQDSILFSGTIRSNIDLLGEYTDAECLEALDRVHLLTHQGEDADTPDGEDPEKTNIITLDTEVSVGGSNFSQGQRQLLSLARALLRQSSIIILDEATSSIDHETDLKIQRTIREEFKNSLLITIAHRIRTVIDYDRLIVLDKGRIVEIDTPHNLIQKEGLFYELCIHSGNLEELQSAAAKAQEEP